VKLCSDNNDDSPTINLLPLFFAVDDDTEVEGVTTGLTLIEALVDIALDVVVPLMRELVSLGLLSSANISSTYIIKSILGIICWSLLP